MVRGRLEYRFVGFFAAFIVPVLGTVRLKLTVVWRVNLTEVDLFVRKKADLARLDPVPVVDRFIARFSRDAIWRECSVASLSARSRAACV